MSETAGEVKIIEAGGVRFEVEFREFGNDRGPACRVLGLTTAQMLRFDCFEVDPHYHFNPDGRNVVMHLNPKADPIEWSVDCIGRNLAEMLRLASFEEIAEQVNMDAVKAILPELCVAFAAVTPKCDPVGDMAALL